MKCNARFASWPGNPRDGRGKIPPTAGAFCTALETRLQPRVSEKGTDLQRNGDRESLRRVSLTSKATHRPAGVLSQCMNTMSLVDTTYLKSRTKTSGSCPID